MPVPTFVHALGNASVNNLACTPGAEVWVTAGGANALTVWINSGFCPAGGTITVRWVTTPSGYNVEGFITNYFGSGSWVGASVFQDTRPVSASPAAGSASSTVSGSVTLSPFEYTVSQQSEMYSTMAVIFGAFLGALALVWALKSVTRIFNWHGNQGD